MNEFYVGTQLFLGFNEKENFTKNDIKKKIISAKELINLQSIMIWTQYDPEIYTFIIEVCKENDIETYLWFPVLSDICSFEVKEEHLLLNYEGSRGYGKFGKWDMLDSLGNAFKFVCSNNPNVMDQVFDILKDLLRKYDFDGVFFDKIRFPSIANGFESLFTCFCEFCQKKFEANYNYSLSSFKDNIQSLMSNIKKIEDKHLKEYQNFDDLLLAFDLKDFFQFRKNNISELVGNFCDYVHSLNKKIGLDLYTPSLSSIVSQDYERLSLKCDWMKPMFYCHTIGPAGIPFEISVLFQALKQLNPKLSDVAIIEFAEKIVDIELSKDYNEIIQEGINEKFIGKEIDKIYNLNIPENVKLYPGVETIINPDYGTNINEEILEIYLKEIKLKTPGFIASWNLLHMPEDNLQYISKLINKKSIKM